MSGSRSAGRILLMKKYCTFAVLHDQNQTTPFGLIVPDIFV